LYAGNILTNGGFETGNFSGWAAGGNFEDTEVVSGHFYDYSGAEEGAWYAVLGPVGGDGTLSQTFSDILGAPYTFSFWLSAVGDNPSDFSAYWDGTQLLSVGDPNTGDVWTEFTYAETGTGSDSIQLNFRDDPAYMALDNVSVSTAIPEPASLTLLAGGLIALAFRFRRRNAA
jgi:hypothetical protein